MTINSMGHDAVPLGKGEVVSSILPGSTTKRPQNQGFPNSTLPCPPLPEREQDANSPNKLGEKSGTMFDGRSAFPLVVAEWDRNSREVVRVALDQYNGRPTVNARVWYRDGDELKPSQVRDHARRQASAGARGRPAEGARRGRAAGAAD